ncbi:DNA mismatch repair protein spel1 [Lycorma delicatula]|uniref:DNA mismatch repair protein spel1 n=1 Tax=Lycorma delicatula TaxID=130591 RepID=UPI003F51566A
MTSKSSQQLTIDSSQHAQFAAYFKSLPEKPSTTIRVFNRVDFYTVHGDDARFAAREVFKTLSFVKTSETSSGIVEYIVLNKSQFESFIRDLLLVKRYRVEIYVNKGTKTNQSWVLEYKGSPGNLNQFEDLLFTNADQVEGCAVIGIKLGGDTKNKIVGMAAVDTTTHTFSLCEYPDDDHFSNLEAMIVQLGPKEVLLSSETNPDIDHVKQIIERAGILVTLCKKSDFSKDGLVQDLNRLILFKDGQQQSSNTLPQMNLTVAVCGLAAVIRYLELCSDQDNFSQFTMNTLDQAHFVYLDAAAVSALNLLPAPGTPAHQRHNSVLGLLDRCRTPQGHRLLSQWVKQPLKDKPAIIERHDVVECLVQDTELRQCLYEDHLRRIPDLQSLAKRVQRKKANMQDCYRIYQAVQRLPMLLEALKNQNDKEPHPTVKAILIDPIEELLGDMKNFQEMIETTLDMDFVDRGEFLIKSEFDEDLQTMRQRMDSIEDEIKSQLNRVARDLSLEPHKAIKLESNSQYGYFFRVTLKDEKVIRGNSKYTQLDTNKSGVRFRNQRLTDLNAEYVEVRDQYSDHQKAVVAEVITVAASYSNPLQQLSDVLAWLDVLTSFATVAACAPKPFVRPVIHDSGTGIFKLTQVRHPCLEVQDNTSYIPNDVHLKAGECTFLMVTGPNMGGKSTYIRSAGVTALLAHIGCFVPCDEAEISVLDAILARVGASDSQIKGMSTFMVEMVETASILRMATSNSLVIIDELGRGTSTYEGCGIAWAIAEYLAKEVKAFSLFATHFHELTRLFEEVHTLHNVHVTAVTSEDNLTLLYEVRPGASDQSFGIHVAKMARFPQHVTEYAKEKLAELEDFKSTVIASDDAQKRKMIKEGEELISEYLNKCKKLKVDEVNDEELQMAIKNLRDEALSKNNPYIQALITKA